MVKAVKPTKRKSSKLHVEIPRTNWERIEAYLKSYNEDEGRMTPKLKLAHVVNQALVQYLAQRSA
ncbi:MAG: hypothetical protein ACOYNX_08630 [Geothrix sp.]